MALFVGRLPSDIKGYELEDIFTKYGKLTRCDIKKGKSFSYGFVEFDNEDDAHDAIDDTDGMDLDGVRIVVEKAKGKVRRSDERGCYNCGEEGHYARDCRTRSRPRYRSRSRSPSRSTSRRYRNDSRSPSPYRRRRHRSYSRSPSLDYSKRRRRRRRSHSVSRSPPPRRRRHHDERSYSRSPSYSRSRSRTPDRQRSLSYSRSPSVDDKRRYSRSRSCSPTPDMDAAKGPSHNGDDNDDDARRSDFGTPDVNDVPAATATGTED